MAVLVVCAATAQAAVQIGATANADQSCGNSTVVQDATAAASPSYVAPAAGVITRWSHQAAASPGTRKLKVLRYTSTAGRYLVVGESALETPAPNQLNNFNTRIPVAQGDTLGVNSATGEACRFTGQSGDTVRGGSGDPAPNTTFNAQSLFASSTLLNLAATIEPDADGDGYGDESQDGCPSEKTVFLTACEADLELSLTSDPARVRLGDQVTYTFSARNNGPTAARDAKITQTLPGGAALVSASDGCTGFATIVCAAGDLTPGAATPTYTVVIRAPSVGTLDSPVTASSETREQAPGNNTRVASVQVDPPVYNGVLISRRSVRVKKKLVPIRVSCPIAARTCTGKIDLTSASRVRITKRSSARKVTLGRLKYSLAGGQARTLKVPLTSGGRKLLPRVKRLRTQVTASSDDSFGQPATRLTTMSILPERRSR